MTIFEGEPTEGGRMGVCPIFKDTVELIDSVKQLPDYCKIVDGNEYKTRYEKDLLTFVKDKTSQRIWQWDRIPVENGGDYTRSEQIANLDNILI